MATVAAIALTVYVQSRPPNISPESLASRDDVVAAVTPVIEATTPDLPDPSAIALPARPATRPRRVQSAREHAAAARLDVGDVAHALHVQMPRTMLPLLGVPIIDPDAPGTVNVEILLGTDGQARTIRIHQ